MKISLNGIPKECLKTIIRAIGEDFSDLLPLGCCSKFLQRSVRTHAQSLTIKGQRHNTLNWMALCEYILSGFQDIRSIKFNQCNVTPDIVSEIVQGKQKQIEVKKREAGQSTWLAASSGNGLSPPQRCLTDLVLTKCFQFTSIKNFSNLPGISTLNSACYGNLGGCRFEMGAQYSNLTILGLTNFEDTDNSFVNDVTNLLTQGTAVPKLEVLFMGGLKTDTHHSRSALHQEHNFPSEPPGAAAGGRGRLPPRLRAVELTFWGDAEVELLGRRLGPGCLNSSTSFPGEQCLLSNGVECGHLIFFDHSDPGYLDKVLFKGGGAGGGGGAPAGGSAVRAAAAAAADASSPMGAARALHRAAVNDDLPRLRWLLGRAAADPDAVDGRGWTPLLRAAALGRAAAAGALLAAGADPWRRNHHAEGALYLAALKGHDEILQLILPRLPAFSAATAFSSGAAAAANVAKDPWAEHDGDGFSPVHAACLRRSPSTAALLLDAGFPVGARNKYQQTPLHLAARAGDLATCRLLLARGADPTPRDEAGRTPAAAAAAHRRPGVARLLAAAAAAAHYPAPPPPPPPHWARPGAAAAAAGPDPGQRAHGRRRQQPQRQRGGRRPPPGAPPQAWGVRAAANGDLAAGRSGQEGGQGGHRGAAAASAEPPIAASPSGLNPLARPFVFRSRK